MNKAELLAIVEASPSSIFARIDVINLISKLDEAPDFPFNLNAFRHAIQCVEEAVEEFERIDYSEVDIELSLNGMEIEVDRVTIEGADFAVEEVQKALRRLKESLPPVR